MKQKFILFLIVLSLLSIIGCAGLQKPKPALISPPTEFIATTDLSGFTLDEEDNLYLLRGMEKEIIKYNARGKIGKRIRINTPDEPDSYRDSALLLDRKGNFYINDEKFDSRGKRITRFHFPGCEVFDQKFDRKGNRYVVRISNKIMKFDSQENEIFTLGQKGLKPGSFNFPSGIVLDKKGNMYITELWNNRVQKFSANGKFLFAFGCAGSGEGEFKNPYGIAIDSQGFIYVADTHNKRIQVFNSKGAYLLQIPLPYSHYCSRIAVDRKDNIYYCVRSVYTSPKGGVDVIYKIPPVEKQLKSAKPKKIYWVSTPFPPKEKVVTPVTLEARIISRSSQTEIKNITSPNHVNQIFLDPVNKNYIWFATEGGLLKYDRSKNQWTTYTTAQGLLENKIFSLFRDENTLWIGSSRGITKYNIQTQEWENIRFQGNSTLYEFSTLKKDRVNPDYFWITSDKGIIRYDKRTEKHFYYQLIKSFDTQQWKNTGIKFDPLRPEITYFFYPLGIITYNHNKDRWKIQFTIDDLVQHRKMPGIGMHAITVFRIDPYNPDFIWIGTVYHGLFQYNRKTKEWKNLRIEDVALNPRINSIAFDFDTIWVGTNKGLYCLDRKTNQWSKPLVFQGLKVSQVVQDSYHSDLIWLAINPTWKGNTYLGGGIYCFDKKENKEELVFAWSKLSGNFINDIAIIGDDVWFGTSPGITKYSKKTNSWHNYWGNSGARVIKQDPVEKKYIWFGTYSGVRRWDANTNYWDYFTEEEGPSDHRIDSIAFSGEEIWFETSNGLSCYNRRTHRWRSYTTKEGLPGRRVSTLAADSSDSRYLWVGFGERGVYRFNKETEEWQHYPQITSLSFLNDIQIDDGRIWCATDGGLICYDPRDDAITIISKRRTQAFLISPQDKKYIWMGQEELRCYNRETKEQITYDRFKGLAANHVRCLAYDEQEECIWVGTTGGVSRISLKEKQSKDAKKMVIKVAADLSRVLSDKDPNNDEQAIKEAIKQYKKIINGNPNCAKAYYKLGRVYFYKQDKVNKAIPAFQKAIELDPKNIRTYLDLGDCYSENEWYKRARQEYEKALALDPDNFLTKSALETVKAMERIELLYKRMKEIIQNEESLEKKLRELDKIEEEMFREIKEERKE